ncbi:MAG TPA: hypothetical protein VLF89_10205 [Candidatus Saccharimonadales bacterium]|nr:hypothetical protein [Candidatus Saccharimonadales bacterium]
MTNNHSSVNNKPQFDIRQSSLTTTLDTMLYEKPSEQDREIKVIHQAKEFLGNEYTTEEIKEIITSFEYLLNNWTEEYEKKIFNNKTLKEILQSI